MRHFDLAPLYRATVGFDQVGELMNRVLASDVSQPSYPPYNIEKTSADTYRITVAVAGFSEDELNVEVREHSLIISAKKADAEGEPSYLHRGIATRAFERRFHLADHVVVTGANQTDGLLHVDLKREIPEALKPRRIDIQRGADVAAVDAQPVN